VKLVAPGCPERAHDDPRRRDVDQIVGVKLEVTRRLTANAYDTAGRPIAVVSNVRVEYTPSR
jgi:hypothetical protein